jgi:hypothetical protein
MGWARKREKQKKVKLKNVFCKSKALDWVLIALLQGGREALLALFSLLSFHISSSSF